MAKRNRPAIPQLHSFKPKADNIGLPFYFQDNAEYEMRAAEFNHRLTQINHPMPVGLRETGTDEHRNNSECGTENAEFNLLNGLNSSAAIPYSARKLGVEHQLSRIYFFRSDTDSSAERPTSLCHPERPKGVEGSKTDSFPLLREARALTQNDAIAGMSLIGRSVFIFLIVILNFQSSKPRRRRLFQTLKFQINNLQYTILNLNYFRRFVFTNLESGGLTPISS